VLAYNRGAVREILEDGVTGFIVDDEANAVAAAGRLASLSRPAVRQRFEQRFTARRMADDYLAVYRELVAAATPSARASVPKRADSQQVRPTVVAP
jgi:glycosyltransferase involved in cell wall biosynthesis